MREVLAVHKIEYKLARMATSEWDKFETSHYKPLENNNAKSKSVLDRAYELRQNFIKTFKNSKKNQFELDRYKTWKEKTDRKLLRVTKDKRKAKEHLRETAKLRKLLEDSLK